MAKTKSDIMHEIEGRHFRRCINQFWDPRRRVLVEIMEWPKANTTAIVVKHFSTSVPRSGSSKPWPDLEACYVYGPIEDSKNTWESLDEALTKAEQKVAA